MCVCVCERERERERERESERVSDYCLLIKSVPKKLLTNHNFFTAIGNFFVIRKPAWLIENFEPS